MMTDKPSFRDYLKQPQQPALVEAALATGKPVFACGENKAPLPHTRGFKDAATDPNRIRSMFSNPAAKMIGMPTGEITGVVVLDVDIKQARDGRAWLNEMAADLVPTYTVRTRSNGLHLYFRHPGRGHYVKNQNDKLAPGIDVRGDGGYVIVPPSPGYEVADASPVAELPPFLLEALCPPGPVEPPRPGRTPDTHRPASSSVARDTRTYGLTALDAECENMVNAPFGQQERTLNESCLKIGGLVAGGALNESVALAALLDACHKMPSQPGRSMAKDEAHVRRSFKEGMASPRSAPEQIIDPATNPAAPFIEKINREFAQAATQAAGRVSSDLLEVDGLLAKIVAENLRTAPRPQPLLALAGAIATVGVLAGRKYCTRTNIRTNVHINGVSESGSGKDHATDVVRSCLFAAGLDRYLGGETIASGRGLMASLEQHPAKLFIIDEFGMFLKNVLGHKAAAHKAEIWENFTKLFSRARGVMGGTEYANQRENARVNIHNPHCVIYATGTPSTFWAALQGSDAMNDGGLARFLLFVTPDERPARRYDHGVFTPSQELINGLRAIASGAQGHDYGGNIAETMAATVPMAPYVVPETPAATSLRRQNSESIEDAWMKRVTGTPAAASVARLAEKSDQLALIRSISRCPGQPMITEADVAWGWALTVHCTRALLDGAGRLLATNEFDAKMQRVREIIRAHGPISEAFIIRRGFKAPARERAEVLQSLLDGGYISILPRAVGYKSGRPTLKYVAAGGDAADFSAGPEESLDD